MTFPRTLTRFSVLGAVLGAALLTAASPAQATPGSPSFSTPAPARNDYYDMEGNSYGSLYYKKRATTLGIALVRMEGLPPGQFVLRLTAGDGVSGCAKISNPAYEVKFQDIYMDVKVDEYVVDMRGQPGTPHYACKQTYQLPTVEIPLDRKDLQDRKIQRIRFNNGPYIDYYDLVVTDHRVQLVPAESEVPGRARYRPQKINNVRNPLLHWLYPENTVILYAPDATGGEDEALRASIDELARGQGLTPLESIIPDFRPPTLKGGTFYYVDKKGKFLKQHAGLSAGAQLGTVGVERSYYGLNGDEVMTQDLQIFAKTPGMYE